VNRVLDLFCGAVGGWSIGFHRAGFSTVAACEVDPWRRAIFRHNFPGVRMYSDVRELSAARLISDLGYLPDIIVGSPPCQDASAANTKGRGIDGTETGLFLEALRLVREVRPAWACFENSPRLRTRGVDRVLTELDEAEYSCWPLVVGADDLGAPHERKRMWLVAADASRRLGPGCGRPRRHGPNGLAAPSIGRPSYADAHAGRLGASAARDDGSGAAGQYQAQDHPHAYRQGEHGLSGDGEVDGQLDRHSVGVARDPDSAGLSLRESLGEDALAQFEALERAVGPTVHTWNGGAARHIGMAHGIAPRLALIRVPDHKHPGHTINAAKACISAQGDAILPQIAEAIARSILRVSEARVAA